MTPDRIAELRRIGQAATPGEWTCHERGHKLLGYDIDEVPAGGRGAFEREEDAEFCCTARNNWDALLDALAASQAENERLKRAIESFGNNPAGFDWGVLAKMDELETEIERLKAMLPQVSLPAGE